MDKAQNISSENDLENRDTPSKSSRKKSVLRHENKNCPNCGGNLIFSPKHQTLFCENCQSTYPIQSSSTVRKHVFDESIDFSEEKNDWASTSKAIKCSNCGATILLGNLEYAKSCPYCKSPNIAQIDDLPGLRPDNIIPFKFDQNDAKQKFVQQVRKKWFLPKKFKKMLPKMQLTGTYVTAFVFDAETISSYKGVLSYTTTHTIRDSDGHSRTVTETHYKSVSGTIDKNFGDLVTESSSLITQNEYGQIYPYNFDECVTFSQDYLRGFVVEHYQQGLQDCSKTADGIMEQQIKSAILQKHNCQRIESLDLSTKFLKKQFSYTLLPLYFFEYTYKNKKYRTVMNGQTGKIGSNIPRCVWKIWLLVILAIAAVVVPAIVLTILQMLGIISGSVSFEF